MSNKYRNNSLWFFFNLCRKRWRRRSRPEWTRFQTCWAGSKASRDGLGAPTLSPHLLLNRYNRLICYTYCSIGQLPLIIARDNLNVIFCLIRALKWRLMVWTVLSTLCLYVLSGHQWTASSQERWRGWGQKEHTGLPAVKTGQQVSLDASHMLPKHIHYTYCLTWCFWAIGWNLKGRWRITRECVLCFSAC